MNNTVSATLMQLLAQSPVLLAYLVGLTLALIFWRRCPIPCALVLVATVLLLVVTLTQPFVSQDLIRAQAERGWTNEKLAQVFFSVGLTFTCLRAAAIGLLLAAVFIGRGISRLAGPNESGASNQV